MNNELPDTNKLVHNQDEYKVDSRVNRALVYLAAILIVILGLCAGAWIFGIQISQNEFRDRQELNTKIVEQSKAASQENENLIFAVCRATHRRDTANADASKEQLDRAEFYIKYHPSAHYAKIELPSLIKTYNAWKKIESLNCHSLMLKAESDYRKGTST